jgi:hypothetical protein
MKHIKTFAQLNESDNPNDWVEVSFYDVVGEHSHVGADNLEEAKAAATAHIKEKGFDPEETIYVGVDYKLDGTTGGIVYHATPRYLDICKQRKAGKKFIAAIEKNIETKEPVEFITFEPTQTRS